MLLTFMLKLLIKTFQKFELFGLTVLVSPVSPKLSSCNFSVTPAALLDILAYQKDENYILLYMYLYL